MWRYEVLRVALALSTLNSVTNVEATESSLAQRDPEESSMLKDD